MWRCARLCHKLVTVILPKEAVATVLVEAAYHRVVQCPLCGHCVVQ